MLNPTLEFKESYRDATSLVEVSRLGQKTFDVFVIDKYAAAGMDDDGFLRKINEYLSKRFGNVQWPDVTKLVNEQLVETGLPKYPKINLMINPSGLLIEDALHGDMNYCSGECRHDCQKP